MPSPNFRNRALFHSDNFEVEFANDTTLWHEWMLTA